MAGSQEVNSAQKIGIVDYGMGNLRSVSNAFEMIGAIPFICPSPEALLDCDRLVLPGVGAFNDCMKNLKDKNFIDPLNELVLNKGKPVLGICLGMQAMAKKGFEGGETPGLGWFDAEVNRMKPADASLKVPQIGWNNLDFQNDHPLFEGLPSACEVYFVHSFHMNCQEGNNVVATCDYGMRVTAAVCKDNIFATQFHPEKSQDYGLKILENFLKWKA